MKMIKLSKPYIPATAFKDIKEILRSGDLVQGKYVTYFEEAASQYLGIPFVKMVSSGTAALHLALMALNIKPGDEVIIPAFTFPATVNVVEVIGAKPVLVDINLTDFCINTKLIEEKITGKTRAIIPVHEFGQSADIKPIIELAKKYDLKVIEDAACALGTEFDGKKAGTFGDIGCFSLHPRKALTTGEGGIVVSSDEQLIERVDLLRSHGARKKDGKIDFLAAGLNYRMTEVQAAIGIPQLKQIMATIKSRIRQAGFYSGFLENETSIVTPASLDNRKNIFQTYHLLLKGHDRDFILTKLREKQIEANLGAQAINCTSYYSNKYNLKESDFPNASTAYKYGLALPIGRHLTNSDIEFVSKNLIDILRIKN